MIGNSLKSDVLPVFSHWRTCCSYSFSHDLARKIDHKVEHENFSALKNNRSTKKAGTLK
jgi:hypothetical protein